MRNIFTKFIAGLILLIGMSGAVGAQTTADLSKIYEPIKDAQRGLLSKRLQIMVAYERAAQWAKLYDLTINSDDASETKAQYAAQRKSWAKEGAPHTLDFVPQSTIVGEGENSYLIFGCLQQREKGKVKNFQGAFMTKMTDGQWKFFGPVPLAMPGREASACVKNDTSLQMYLSRNEWTLTKIGDQEISGGKAFIKFDDEKMRVSGSGGCNSFGGSYTKDGADIKIAQIISTKMACIDENRMKTENDFFKNLAQVTKYNFNDGKLQLFASGAVVLEFKKK